MTIRGFPWTLRHSCSRGPGRYPPRLNPATFRCFTTLAIEASGWFTASHGCNSERVSALYQSISASWALDSLRLPTISQPTCRLSDPWSARRSRVPRYLQKGGHCQAAVMVGKESFAFQCDLFRNSIIKIDIIAISDCLQAGIKAANENLGKDFKLEDRWQYTPMISKYKILKCWTRLLFERFWIDKSDMKTLSSDHHAHVSKTFCPLLNIFMRR